MAGKLTKAKVDKLKSMVPPEATEQEDVYSENDFDEDGNLYTPAPTQTWDEHVKSKGWKKKLYKE